MKVEDQEKYLQENPLSPNLKEKYILVGVLPGKIKHKKVQYDLRRMSDEVAEKLAEDKSFPYLIAKDGKSTDKSLDKVIESEVSKKDKK